MAKIPSNFGNSLGATAGTGSPIMSGGYQVPFGNSGNITATPIMSGTYQVPNSNASNGNMNGLFNQLFGGFSGTPAKIPFAGAPVDTPGTPYQGTPQQMPTTGAGAGSQVPLQRFSAYNAARSY